MKDTEIKDTEGKINFGYVLALIFLLTSMFFLSPNLTGNVIGNLDNSYSSFLSLVLFVFGLATFLIMKKR
jgi:hypothetical protein